MQDVLVVERTYPHVDMAERAQHAAELMARTLSGEVRPTMAWCSLPILWSAKKMLEGEHTHTHTLSLSLSLAMKEKATFYQDRLRTNAIQTTPKKGCRFVSHSARTLPLPHLAG